jgi:PAS domain S-box-containing protein
VDASNKLSILIVEDDPAFTAALAQMMEVDYNADTVVVDNYLAAKMALMATSYDLITLDFQIPGGNGLELLKDIKSDDDSPPVIMVTGHGDERIASEAFQLGAAGYVVKDGRATALLPETIKSTLEKEAYRKALEESEKKFRLLAENMSDNIWILDLRLNRIYTSPSVERILGYKPAEAIAQPIAQSMTAESFDAATEVLLEELRKEDEGGADPDRTRTIELEECHKDGTTVWTESIVKFLRDDEGKVNAILGVSRDISDRKKALDDLRESEERFRIIAANVPGLLWTTDLTGSFTYMSPAVEKYGYTVEEILKTSLDRIMTPESFRRVADLLARELDVADETAHVSATVFELELLRKDGTAFGAEVSAGFLRDSGNKPYGVLGTAREITDGNG